MIDRETIAIEKATTGGGRGHARDTAPGAPAKHRHARFRITSKAAEAIARSSEAYGAPAVHFERAARLWSALLDTDVAPYQVAACMAGLKLARLIEAPEHEDSAVDLAGYAAILHELALAELNGREAPAAAGWPTSPPKVRTELRVEDWPEGPRNWSSWEAADCRFQVFSPDIKHWGGIKAHAIRQGNFIAVAECPDRVFLVTKLVEKGVASAPFAQIHAHSFGDVHDTIFSVGADD